MLLMAAPVLGPPHRWLVLSPLGAEQSISSKARCDLPPFHALTARRTLAG
jgi:hypothetical protein